jgi:hypothetical protein
MRVCVADYSIKFLSVADLNAKPERKQRLKAVIEQLKPDIVAGNQRPAGSRKALRIEYMVDRDR